MLQVSGWRFQNGNIALQQNDLPSLMLLAVRTLVRRSLSKTAIEMLARRLADIFPVSEREKGKRTMASNAAEASLTHRTNLPYGKNQYVEHSLLNISIS